MSNAHSRRYLTTLTPAQSTALWSDFRGASDSPFDFAWKTIWGDDGEQVPQGTRGSQSITWSNLRQKWLYAA